ncbi:hypothetical protein A5881_000715 [Enterococcus termitis]|nr:hypothetical protein A5881_000919 [Enterococcus termitis]
MKRLMTIMGMLVLFLQAGLVVYAQENQKEASANETIEKQVDQIMEKYIGKEIPGASIGIVKDGKVILTKGYGVSDIEKKTPVNGDTTIFETASVTKVFTWSMLMKLAEEGKVKLDADIQEYLPKGTLNLAFDKKITILDLMNHTAGFEEKLEGMDLKNKNQLKPLKETITKENQPKQVYEPGTVTSYSNYGANLAGYIIEQVTGQEYMKYMNQTVLKPLQMNYSTFSMIYDDQPLIKDNKSSGYLYDGSKFEKMNVDLTNDFPAGSLKSTATDMTHVMLALLNDGGKTPYNFFEQKETSKQMQAHSYGIVPGALGNAHGYWEEEVGGKRIIQHGGNSGGFSSQLNLVPEDGLGYILLTNLNNEATGIRNELNTLLVGNEKITFDLPLKKSSNDQKVAGRYRMARQPVSTLGKVAYIIADFDMVVKANKEGGITVTSPQSKKGIYYVEVKPGIYQKIQKGSKDKYLYFKLNDKGQVLTAGNGMTTDSLPVSFLDTQLFNFITFGVSFAAFLGSLIYLSVKFVKQKRRKKVAGWSRNYTVLAVFSTVGLLVMITAVVMIFKYASNLSIVFSSMQPLYYINCLLPLFTIGMIIWLARTWRKNEAKWLTIFLILIGLITTLQFYNVHLFF